MSTIVVSALLPKIQNSLQLTFTEAGLVVVMPLTMLIFLSLAGGLLGDRYGYRRFVSIAIAVVALGSFLRGESSTFDELLFGSAIMGFGLALMYPNLQTMIRALFPSNLRATATGTYSSGIASGSTAAFGLTSSLLSLFGSWNNITVLLGILGVLPLFLWITLVVEPTNSNIIQSGQQESWKSMLTSREVLMTSLMVLFLNAIFYGLIAWLPTYLTSVRGITANTAGLLTALLTGAEVLGLFLLPLLSDLLGVMRPLLILFFALLGLLSIGTVYVPVRALWMTMAFVGFSIGGLFSQLLTLPAELGGPRAAVGKKAGVILSIGYIGSLLGAPLVGYFRDISGSFELGFASLLVFAMCAVFSGLVLPETGARHLRGGGLKE